MKRTKYIAEFKLEAIKQLQLKGLQKKSSNEKGSSN